MNVSDFVKIIKIKPQVYLMAMTLSIKFIKFNLLLTKVSIQLVHLGTNKIKSNQESKKKEKICKSKKKMPSHEHLYLLGERC